MRGIFLNWHLVLDTTITQFLAIYFAHIQRFDLAAAIAITDSVIKLIFTIPCATLSTRLDLLTRVNICAFQRPALAILWALGFLSFNTDTNIAIIIAIFVTFKILSIFDTTLSSDFVFLAKDSFGLDLSQSNSIQNIISRASLAIAPAFSLAILAHKLNIACVIGVTLVTIGISTTILKMVLRPQKDRQKGTGPTHNESPSMLRFSGIFGNDFMRWGLLYQTFVNFSFGGISYLLVIKISKNVSLAINELSTLYFFFLIYSVAIAFRGDFIVPARRLQNIAQTVAATAALSIALTISSSLSFNLMLCGAMGLLYAYELAATQKVLTPKLRGPAYIRYSALSKIAGRAASASGVAALGACIEMGMSSASLFLACGLSGLCCAFVLCLSNPERRRQLSALR